MRGAFAAIFDKELRDALRDRRSLFAALIYPLFGPLLVVAMLQWMGRKQAPDRPLDVVIVGADRAPNLVAYLRAHGVRQAEAPADPERAVADGDLDAVLEIPEDYGKALREQRPAPVRVVTDGSRADAMRTAARLEALLGRYGQGIGAGRLLLRGIDPRIVRAVAVERVDVASDQARAALVLGALPLFVVISAFVGGMYVATDTTAGERERGSLEPLLLHPVHPLVVVCAKWAVTTLFSATSLVLTAVALWAAFGFVPLEGLGVEATLGPALAGGLVAMAVPLAPLVAGVQMLVAIFARSYKESQTYLSLLMFLPMVVGILPVVEPIAPRPWMAAVPVFGPMVALGAVLRGAFPGAGYAAVAALVSLAVAGLAVVVTARLLRSERIVFGR